MTETLDDVKTAVRAFLRAHAQPVPAKTATSRKEHLEVWQIGERSRAAGIEFDHGEILNIWVIGMNAPRVIPGSVKVARKTPKGRAWTDDNGEGANSNLSSYDEFRTKPIVRFGVTSTADARLILDHLNR